MPRPVDIADTEAEKVSPEQTSDAHNLAMTALHRDLEALQRKTNRLTSTLRLEEQNQRYRLSLLLVGAQTLVDLSCISLVGYYMYLSAQRGALAGPAYIPAIVSAIPIARYLRHLRVVLNRRRS